MLFILALAGALLAGHGMAGNTVRSWLHIVSFAAMITVTVYVILDLEFPRLGLIRVTAFDRALVDLLETHEVRRLLRQCSRVRLAHLV